jgi:hypothetical protein
MGKWVGKRAWENSEKKESKGKWKRRRVWDQSEVKKRV